MPGYNDTDNMWVKLCNLEKMGQEPPQKHLNDRSCIQIQVHDKVFRLKKNPFYNNQSKLAHKLTQEFNMQPVDSE